MGTDKDNYQDAGRYYGDEGGKKNYGRHGKCRITTVGGHLNRMLPRSWRFIALKKVPGDRKMRINEKNITEAPSAFTGCK
jgi:hypothetical protein